MVQGEHLMGNPIVEDELAEACSILEEILIFRQFGARGPATDEEVQSMLDRKVEHFLRRDEPESAYYERFGDHSLADG